jgi:uncharacterized protein YaaW (UPF0174 family)
MIDSLSKCEPIHFKKDISGFKRFNEYLELFEEKINKFIEYEEFLKNKLCSDELKRIKNKIEKEIKYNNNRIEMLK